MTTLSLYAMLNTLPPELKKEAEDFIEFLVQKAKKNTINNNDKPKFGSLKGKIQMSNDFDAPLDVFKDYMQ